MPRGWSWREAGCSRDCGQRGTGKEWAGAGGGVFGLGVLERAVGGVCLRRLEIWSLRNPQLGTGSDGARLNRLSASH